MNWELNGKHELVDEEKVYRIFRRIPSDFAHSRDFSLKTKRRLFGQRREKCAKNTEIRGKMSLLIHI